jgi:hypothetical protein
MNVDMFHLRGSHSVHGFPRRLTFLKTGTFLVVSSSGERPYVSHHSKLFPQAAIVVSIFVDEATRTPQRSWCCTTKRSIVGFHLHLRCGYVWEEILWNKPVRDRWLLAAFRVFRRPSKSSKLRWPDCSVTIIDRSAHHSKSGTSSFDSIACQY